VARIRDEGELDVRIPLAESLPKVVLLKAWKVLATADRSS